MGLFLYSWSFQLTPSDFNPLEIYFCKLDKVEIKTYFFQLGKSSLTHGGNALRQPMDAWNSDSTEPYTYYVFFDTYITIIKFNL